MTRKTQPVKPKIVLTHKVCKRCRRQKDITEFYLGSTGYYATYCKKCNYKKVRAFVAADGDRLRRYQRDHFKRAIPRNRAYVAELKNVPCADCGVRYPPYIMDFDHLPEFEKKANIGELARTQHSTAYLLAEATKCEVVCSNCHRERTHQRRCQENAVRDAAGLPRLKTPPRRKRLS